MLYKCYPSQLKTRRQRVGLRTQDFFHFRLEGLAKMAARHGSKSDELAAAVNKFEQFIRQASLRPSGILPVISWYELAFVLNHYRLRMTTDRNE